MAKIAANLGCEGMPLTMHLIKYALHEPADRAVRCRVSEKHDHAFAKVDLQLPLVYEGGELVVSRGLESTDDGNVILGVVAAFCAEEDAFTVDPVRNAQELAERVQRQLKNAHALVEPSMESVPAKSPTAIAVLSVACIAYADCAAMPAPEMDSLDSRQISGKKMRKYVEFCWEEVAVGKGRGTGPWSIMVGRSK
ncbi:hypothetical protein AMAG_19086 [Allomyces macrogynus ATCC 38327]|uniref:Uncharacterized protein n=1 Tax=Allomyces macrogynus (strain ATCC 38327) TaxID=578462 RepID=A0A0L0SNC9_ALLM3|nr:hypothetical protein AMAG_19086 [Allomyces macrogynus ATCC 38327]|eukprot:KNE63889.1 hypothetical protein AMAG_19086 [Allomyces macrogynus ATCC 38327]